MATGATQLRAAFPADQLDGVLRAYMAGLKVAFAIATGAVGVSVPVSLLSKWKRIHADGGVGGAV